MSIFGVGPDVIVAVLLLVGWIVLMRFILPRLGIST
jgi:hypothetical protein